MRKFVLLAFVFLLFTTIVSPSAEGSSLTLSTHASDGASPPPAEQLDATLDFSVVDDTTLTLTVTNLTPDLTIPDATTLRINEIYFNAKDYITDLFLTGVSAGNIDKWVWDFVQGGDGASHQVNAFGRFDVYLKDAPGNPQTFIGSGDSLTFTFEINGGVGSFSANDFIELSTQVDGHQLMYAAAKFYDGPNVSAYGATDVPEPASILLLGLGAFALLRKRRA